MPREANAEYVPIAVFLLIGPRRIDKIKIPRSHENLARVLSDQTCSRKLKVDKEARRRISSDFARSADNRLCL